MYGGSYVVNLFKQKVLSQKMMLLLPWQYTTIFFVIDTLTIFTPQIVHSHMHWGKICLHSLAYQKANSLEKMCSTKYHSKATWTVLFDWRFATRAFAIVTSINCSVQSCTRASFWSPNPALARNYFWSPTYVRKPNLPSESKYAQLRGIKNVVYTV